MRRLAFVTLTVAVGVAAAVSAPFAGAQVYKWTDERGVVNYSNTPPPEKSKIRVSVVEDRVSVYEADPALVEATRNARERNALPPAPPPLASPRPMSAPPPAAPPPVAAVDPCASGYDPVNCYAIYDGPPVFVGRRRPPRLVQPELPAGSIAGNVNAGGGFTPGLSTQAPLGARAPRVRRDVPQRARARDLPAR